MLLHIYSNMTESLNLIDIGNDFIFGSEHNLESLVAIITHVMIFISLILTFIMATTLFNLPSVAADVNSPVNGHTWFRSI